LDVKQWNIKNHRQPRIFCAPILKTHAKFIG
jgi:hypothetical protein